MFDLIVAFRGLRKSPGFALVAIATLALGIGANTTMFSVVNAVLLRPLPGYQTDRLVRVINTGHDRAGFVDPDAFKEIRKQSRSFEQLAGLTFCQFSLTGDAEPEQVIGPCTTANWFEMQRVPAMIGRTFLPDEDQPGRAHVAVLSYALWQTHFHGDPKIAGRKTMLDGKPWEIIGVMPRDFTGLGVTQPMIFTPDVITENPAGLSVTGRLRQGVSLEAARVELGVIAGRMSRANPADWKDLRLDAVPELEQVAGPQRPLLLLLLGAVSFVLLIACVNVANLLLARSAARRHEMDIRIALGATRTRIARFVLAESLLIALPASAAAIGIAYASLRALRPLLGNLPRAEEITIDVRVLACSLVMGILAALLFGIIPAMRAGRNPTRSGRRWQRGLLGAEVALAFVLLCGAGLLIRTFEKMRHVDLGYDPHNVVTNMLSLPPSPDGKRAAGTAMFARIRERIAAIPGVRGTATSSNLPSGGVGIIVDVEPEGQPARHNDHRTNINVVSDAYLSVAGIPLRAGRFFDSTDREGARPVIVVSETIARDYFAGNAIGKRLKLPEIPFNLEGEEKYVAGEIIGVVGDVCTATVRDCRTEQVYLPESQAGLRVTYILVRSEHAVGNEVKHAVYLESPNTPLDEARTMEQRTAYLTDGPQRAMWLLGVFAGLALVLAAVGIYGVTAYLATQRQREIGIRMALGATFYDIASLMASGALTAALAGIAAGGLGAAYLARFLAAELFGVTPTDPRTIGAAALTLVVTAVLATAQPACRAALADPARVLHRE